MNITSVLIIIMLVLIPSYGSTLTCKVKKTDPNVAKVSFASQSPVEIQVSDYDLGTTTQPTLNGPQDDRSLFTVTSKYKLNNFISRTQMIGIDPALVEKNDNLARGANYIYRSGGPRPFYKTWVQLYVYPDLRFVQKTQKFHNKFLSYDVETEIIAGHCSQN